MKPYIRLMRPQQYIKNLLVLVPLMFSGRLLEPGLLLRVLAAFAVFSLLCSVVYIINDIKDVEADRAHSTKRLRPIASGAVSIGRALVLAVALLVVVVGLMLMMGLDIAVWLIAGAYLAINLLYSVAGLKKLALVDVLLLVSGFVLRMAFGAAVVAVPISNWLYLTVISAAFYMGFGKRRNELNTQAAGGETRAALKGYTLGFLEKSMTMCMTLSVAFYALWSIDEATVAHHSNPYAVWSVPLVMALVFRYAMDVEQQTEGNPVDVILHDKFIWLLGVIYIVLMYWVVYGL